MPRPEFPKIPPTFAWFPLIVTDWQGSSTVQRMTMSDRGIYLTFLMYQWQWGDLPASGRTRARGCNIRAHTCARFAHRFPRLFTKVPGKPDRIWNLKLAKLRPRNGLIGTAAAAAPGCASPPVPKKGGTRQDIAKHARAPRSSGAERARASSPLLLTPEPPPSAPSPPVDPRDDWTAAEKLIAKWKAAGGIV